MTKLESFVPGVQAASHDPKVGVRIQEPAQEAGSSPEAGPEYVTSAVVPLVVPRRALDLPVVHIWDMQDGKAVRFRQFADTVKFADVVAAADSVAA